MRKFENWTIAFRKKNKSILEDCETPFNVIPNSWRYWRADPFGFDMGEETYLFAELYDRVLRRGVLGCTELTETGSCEWKVILKEPFHLSYPNVFEHNGIIYMIPESYVANEIRLYKSTMFPTDWEFVTALSDACAVDSTMIKSDDKQYLMTQILNENENVLAVFKTDNRLELSNMFTVSDIDHDNFRPAGNPFVLNGELFRPSQDCSESYGCALNIAKIDRIGDNEYREHIVKKIHPDQINTNTHQKYCGIHTYNFSDRYEVIDLKDYETDYFYPVMRVFWAVWRRIKRLTGK